MKFFQEHAGDRVSASAVIQITLEVPANSSWGGDCDLKQIHAQASDETLNGVLTTLRVKFPRVRVVGKPVVTTVLTREKR